MINKIDGMVLKTSVLSGMVNGGCVNVWRACK